MCQEFKDLPGCLELENRARMGSLANQDFQVVKGSKDCQGCLDPQASQGLESQASQDPKGTGASGVFLGLLDQEGKKDQWVLLEWEVLLENQAYLECQGPWGHQVLLVSLDPKEKVGWQDHRVHQVPRVSQASKASLGSQVFLVK